MVYIALFRVLAIGGRRVLLKLCFQVFIVLSPADEAGACRVHEGAWGDCGIDDLQGGVFRSSQTVHLVVRYCSLVLCSNLFVARVKLITARTASMSGFQSSVSVVDLPPSRRESLSSPFHTPKIFRCSLHLTQ
jgi:hypothetical protein